VDLKSPWTFAVAWLLVPLLVALTAAGLGAGLSVLSGLRLGILTIPSGFLAGIALITFALEIGLGGVLAVWVCAVCAAGGAIVFVAPRREMIWPPRRRPNLWPPWRRSSLVWPGLAGLAAFAAGLAPLVGAGRAGIAGYVLDNDSSVHISAVELLHEHGANPVDLAASSFDVVGSLFRDGYPLGSYAWPLFGSVIGATGPFYIWTPLIALTAGITALIVFWLLRDFGASSTFSAAAAAVIACGYLPYSYLVQGGAKEVATPPAVYGTIALVVLSVRQGVTWRTLVPAGLGAAAAVDVIGLGAVAWLGPAVLVVAVGLLWRMPRGFERVRTARDLALATVVAVGAALPGALSSLKYLRDSEDLLINPAQIGNLLGPVPWSEAFNVWLASDYRYPIPEREHLTAIAVLIAAGLAIAGAAYAVFKRSLGLPLVVFAGVAAAIIISARYSIYFDAKSYMVMAPALGMATAAGLVLLFRLSLRTRIAAIALGAVLATGVAASDGMVYAGAWITPKNRFQELIDIGKRFRGRGPILVNEREDYAKYFLHGSAPWESWGSWQPDRGLRFPVVPPVPQTPDFDDYTSAHMARFRLLLERKRPGGSLPPGDFRPVFETGHYRVWERSGPPVRDHVPLGLNTLAGTGRLDCKQKEARDLLAGARKAQKAIRVAYGGPPPVTSPPARWQQYPTLSPSPTKGLVSWRTGFAIAEPSLRPGRYVVYAQGSFGPGLRVLVNGRRVGEAFADLGLQDGWQELGQAVIKKRRPDFVLFALQRPWWKSGSRRYDIIGPLAFVGQGSYPHMEEVAPSRASTLCGRALDWVELP
jgi:hypothetical protein